MPALHISPKNPHTHHESIHMLKNAPIAFILVYMEGCGPCGEVRPEWEKIYKDKPFLNTLDPRVVMADIDHTVLGIDANKDLIKDPPNAFPNIRKVISYPSEQMYEEYNGNRSSEDIKNWITSSLKDSSLKDDSSLKKSSLKKSANHHNLSNHHNSYSFGGGSSKKTKRRKNKNKNNKKKKSKNKKGKNKKK